MNAETDRVINRDNRCSGNTGAAQHWTKRDAVESSVIRHRDRGHPDRTILDLLIHEHPKVAPLTLARWVADTPTQETSDG